MSTCMLKADGIILELTHKAVHFQIEQFFNHCFPVAEKKILKVSE